MHLNNIQNYLESQVAHNVRTYHYINNLQESDDDVAHFNKLIDKDPLRYR